MHVPAPAPGRLLVALGMGSNLAPVAQSPFDLDEPSDARARALEGALVLLRRAGHVLRAASPLYETTPQDVSADHGPYLNACVLLEVAEPPSGGRLVFSAHGVFPCARPRRAASTDGPIQRRFCAAS